MERMKNLEIERLKQESNERADEVARLEEVVEQGKKTITQHAQRVSDHIAIQSTGCVMRGTHPP